MGASALPPPTLGPAEPTLVYESIRLLDTSGVQVSSTVVGELDLHVLQRVARPWSYLSESTIYHQQIWQEMRPGDLTEHGYRVWAVPNDSPIQRLPTSGPPEVSPQVIEVFATGGAGAADVIMNLRNFPDWDVPPMPSMPLPIDELQAAAAARAAAITRREQLFDSLATPVIEAIESTGGVILAKGRRSGWLEASVGRATYEALASRTDLYNLDLVAKTGGLCGSIGSERRDHRTGAQRFIDNHYDGDEPNHSRHSFSDITVAVQDTMLEDEACFLYDGPGCTGSTRLQERFRCNDSDEDGNDCEPVANFPDEDPMEIHGTTVTSVLLADYEQGQANGKACGDPLWTSAAHSSAWESDASSGAPEARLISFVWEGPSGAEEAGFADAFDDAADRLVDIFNGSWSWGTDCTPRAIQSYEQELENAFDDGVFVVMAAGNNDSGTAWSTCSLTSPADTPKAFAVNAYNTYRSACDSSYNNCKIDAFAHRRGGMGATINGVVYSGVISGVALVAGTDMTGATSSDGDYGTVDSFVPVSGTSHAAPQVAGLAVLLKDQYLANGDTWINDPGWMSTIMLGMADRHRAPFDVATSQGTIGADLLYGFGKVRMRLLNPNGGLGSVGTSALTTTWPPSLAGASTSTVLFSAPLPAGTGVIKCVLTQAEDMSPPKIDVSDIDLKIDIHSPLVPTTCSIQQMPGLDVLGTQTFTRADTSRDLKSMVAIESSEAALAGKCVKLTLNGYAVASAGVTTRTWCYFAGTPDDVMPL